MGAPLLPPTNYRFSLELWPTQLRHQSDLACSKLTIADHDATGLVATQIEMTIPARRDTKGHQYIFNTSPN